jgi:hypothetical protein
VASPQACDIAFVARGATPGSPGLGPDSPLPGVAVVQNGPPEVVARTPTGSVQPRP